MIPGGYRTAKEGKTDARWTVNMFGHDDPGAIVNHVTILFGPDGGARKCTTAYRTAFMTELRKGMGYGATQPGPT